MKAQFILFINTSSKVRKWETELLLLLKYFTVGLLFLFTIVKYKLMPVEVVGELKYFTTLSLFLYVGLSYGLNQFIYKIKLIGLSSIYGFVKLGTFVFVCILMMVSFGSFLIKGDVLIPVLFLYSFVYFVEQILISMNILHDKNYKNTIIQLVYVVFDIIVFSVYYYFNEISTIGELLGYLALRSICIFLPLIYFNCNLIRLVLKSKISFKKASYFFRRSWSFALLIIIAYGSNNADVYFVEWGLSTYELGLYSFLLLIKSKIMLSSMLYVQKMTPNIKSGQPLNNTNIFSKYRYKGAFSIFLVSTIFITAYEFVIQDFLPSYAGLIDCILVICFFSFLYSLVGASGTVLSLHGLQKFNIYSELIVFFGVSISLALFLIFEIGSIFIFVLVVNVFWLLGNVYRTYQAIKNNILVMYFKLLDFMLVMSVFLILVSFRILYYG